MMNVKVSMTDGELCIRVPLESIKAEVENPDWLTSHFNAKVIDVVEMGSYLVSNIDEPSIDVGNGDVSPFAHMIMDVLASAFENGEDFLEEIDEEDED